MIRPALEVADILRALRNRFLKRFKFSRSYQLLKVFRAIVRGACAFLLVRSSKTPRRNDAALRCISAEASPM